MPQGCDCYVQGGGGPYAVGEGDTSGVGKVTLCCGAGTVKMVMRCDYGSVVEFGPGFGYGGVRLEEKDWFLGCCSFFSPAGTCGFERDNGTGGEKRVAWKRVWGG